MGKKYSNAASEYDNTIEPSKKKGGFLSSLKSKLSDSLNTISGGLFGKLNELKSKLMSFDLSALSSKLKGLLGSFLDNALDMLKDMAKDALNSLKNAGKNFAMNIAEQFYNDIKATLYIEDIVFSKTIEALYYTGADLAYNNHYIRNSALSRDWNYTLKFVDQQYKIEYSLQYDKLENDLKTAAKNGCFKNISYIFESMRKFRNDTNSQIALTNNDIAALDYDPTTQKALKNTVDTLTDSLNKYDELMVKYTYILITYSYSSFTTNRVKDLIKESDGIVLPKYFGQTDDKYSKRYNFNVSDCKRMMPDYTQTLSNTDKKTLQEIDEQNQENQDEDDELRDIANSSLQDSASLEAIAAFAQAENIDSKIVNNINQQASYYKTNAKIKEWRAKYESKLSSQNKALSKTALTTGVKKVTKDNRARYHKNYDGSTVKYVSSLADGIDKFGNKIEDGYISLRNKYIKAIYILLSSKEIYGSDRMVNEVFYNRCKMKTANALYSAMNKATGLLGASSLVQSIYDISDVIDGSAYNYTKKVENWLYDPKTNVDIGAQVDTIGSMFYDPDTDNITFTIDDTESNNIVNTSDMSAVIKNPNVIALPSSDSTVSNEEVYDELETKMSQNTSSKKKILDISRYVDKIPIGTKRDILIKYITWFYDNIQVRGISKDIAGECLSKLVYSIFGRTGFTSTGNLDSLFTNTTNSALNKNLQTFISISVLNVAKEYLQLDRYDNNTAGEISDIFDMAAYAFAMEVKNTSFAKAVFLYDIDYMKTLAKQKYESEINQLKTLNTPDNYSNFYSIKDNMTKTYDGFDRFGIFGFDERSGFIVKYTNVIIGDWNSICVTDEGTFFGGSDFTKNNGIRYLDEDSDTIKATSIKSGTWNIIERNKRAFFINITGDLYTWNSNNKDVDKVLTKEGNKYEFIEFPEYDLIIANGNSNNGLMIFNGTSFDKISTSGSNFKYFKEKNFLIFYTSEGSSKVIGIDVINNNQIVYLTSESYSLTTPIRFTETHTITTTSTITPVLPDGTQGTPVTTTTVSNKYKHHILFGRLDKGGVYDCLNISDNEDEYTSSWEQDTTISLNDMSLYLVKLDNNIMAIKLKSLKTDLENVYIIKPILNHSYTNSTSGDSTSGSGESSPPVIVYEKGYEDIEKDHQYAEASNFSLVNDVLFFKANYLTDKDKDVWEYSFFVHNYSDKEIYNMDVSNNDTIYFYNPNYINLNLIFGKDKNTNHLYYYDSGNHNVKTLFDDSKYLVSDIKYISINRKYAQLYSNNSNFGVILYNNDDNSVIETNLTSGNYKILEGNNYYYALSQNGTNKGVLYSKKPYFTFIDITEGELNRYDMPAFSYDNDLKRVYIGVERSKSVLDIDSIKYDINEYIFLRNSYQLYKDMESTISNITDSILSELSTKLSGIDPSKIKPLSSEELENGPISGKEYFIVDETTGNLISVGDSLESFDPNENYYAEDKSTESTVSFSKLSPEEIQKGPDENTIYYKKDIDTGKLVPVGIITEFDPSTEYFVKDKVVKEENTNSFDRLSPEEIKKGPDANTIYYKKDIDTGRLIPTGIITKFDPSIEYFVKNEVVKEEKYVLISTSEKENGPVDNTEYFIKVGSDYISVGNEITSFDTSKDYYKEINPINGVPIFSFEKLSQEEIQIGPNINIEYCIKAENGEYISVGNISSFEPETNYYIRVQDRSPEPFISSSMVEITSTERENGPINNKKYYIKNNETNSYSLVGIGNVTLNEFIVGTTYYVIKESEIISSSSKTTADIMNELAEKWESYLESLNEIEKSSPFYIDLSSLSMANEEFDVDDPNETNGIVLDLILGDEGKNSIAYLLLKDNEKKYIISDVDPRYEHLKPDTPEWNMANEYTSIDFLNSDEEDLENLIKK